MFVATATFLKEEGFIRMSGTGGDFLHKACLTSKGFSAMNAIPESIAGAQTIQQRIKNGLLESSREAVKAAIVQLIAFGAQRVGLG